MERFKLCASCRSGCSFPKEDTTSPRKAKRIMADRALEGAGCLCSETELPVHWFKGDMDIFAHALWTNLLFYEADTTTRVTAIALSVMPDIVPFGPTTIKSLFSPVKRDPTTGRVSADSLDYKFSWWAYRGYDLTHSLPIWLTIFGLLWWILGSVPLAMFGWLVHVLVDIPSHRRSFFGTPFLWPFSNYRFDGISWGERWFLRLNYASLAALYAYLIVVYWVNGKATQ